MAGSSSGRGDGDMVANCMSFKTDIVQANQADTDEVNESAIAEKTIMRSSSIPIEKDSTKISTLCHQCLATYQKLSENIRDLSADEAEDRGFDREEKLVATQDSKSRLKAWAVNIAALQKGNIQSSLEFRLKDAIEIRQRIIKILEELDRTLHNASLIATGEKTNRTWRVGYISDSEDEEEDDISEDFPETSELDQLFSTMNATNTNLMKLSVIIRDSPARDDYLKAASRYRFDPQYDIGHVHEKHGSAKGSKDWLVQRLGKSITRRRQFLKYREEHHGKLARDWDAPEDEIKPEKTIAMTKATTFVEIKATGAVFERPDGSEAGGSFGSQTSYDQTVMGETAVGKLTVPPPPAMAFEGVPFQYGEYFQCPYCYTEQKVKNRAAWKKHVFRDLRPYVCTFKECNMRMFRSRNEWFTHELQSHRRQWICVLCANHFISKNTFSAHLASTHYVTESDPQLNALILQSEESVDSISSSACPFCNEWEGNMLDPKQDAKWAFLSDQKNTKPYGTLKHFRRHLGRHMEQLALFALPMADNEDLEDDSAGDDSDDNASVEDGEPNLDESKTELGMLGKREEDIFKQPAESQSRTKAVAEVMIAQKRIELVRLLENENRSEDGFGLIPSKADNKAVVNHFLALCNILKGNYVEACNHIIGSNDQDIVDGPQSIATAKFQSQIHSTLSGILRRNPKFWDLQKFQEQISSDLETTDRNLASLESILKEQSSRLPMNAPTLKEYHEWCESLRTEQLLEELVKLRREIKLLPFSEDYVGEGGLPDFRAQGVGWKIDFIETVLTERGVDHESRTFEVNATTEPEISPNFIPREEMTAEVALSVPKVSPEAKSVPEPPKNGSDFDMTKTLTSVISKGTYNGKKYDFVFTIEIKDGEPLLMLPYNLSQNPSEVASRFIKEKQLPITYLNQLISLIENSTAELSANTLQPKASSDPVSETFLPLDNELLQIKLFLYQMKHAGGASSIEELEPYRKKLDSIAKMKSDGKFKVGQDFPEGQDIIDELLAECRVLEEEIFTLTAQKLVDKEGEEHMESVIESEVNKPVAEVGRSLASLGSKSAAMAEENSDEGTATNPKESARENKAVDEESTTVTHSKSYTDFLKFTASKAAESSSADREKLSSKEAKGGVISTESLNNQEEKVESEDNKNGENFESPGIEKPTQLGGLFAGEIQRLKKATRTVSSSSADHNDSQTQLFDEDRAAWEQKVEGKKTAALSTYEEAQRLAKIDADIAATRAAEEKNAWDIAVTRAAEEKNAWEKKVEEEKRAALLAYEEARRNFKENEEEHERMKNRYDFGVSLTNRIQEIDKITISQETKVEAAMDILGNEEEHKPFESLLSVANLPSNASGGSTSSTFAGGEEENEIEEDGEKEVLRNSDGVEAGSSMEARSFEGDSKTRDKGKAVEETVSAATKSKPAGVVFPEAYKQTPSRNESEVEKMQRELEAYRQAQLRNDYEAERRRREDEGISKSQSEKIGEHSDDKTVYSSSEKQRANVAQGEMQILSERRRRQTMDNRQSQDELDAMSDDTASDASWSASVSPPTSVNLMVHDDVNRHVTLRRLTEAEATAEREARSTDRGRRRAGSISSLSSTDTEGASLRRFRRSDREAERRAESSVHPPPPPRMAPLSPLSPAFVSGRRLKDSAYYSGRPHPSPPLVAEASGSMEALPSRNGHISSRSNSLSPPRSVKVTAHDDKDHNATIRRLTEELAGSVTLEAASSSRRRSSWNDQPESTASSGYEQQLRQAANYQEDVFGDSVPLTAELLRKQQKREASRRSTKSKDDYPKSATTRATRGDSSYDDENMNIKVRGQARVMIGGTQIDATEGGEIEIKRVSGEVRPAGRSRISSSGRSQAEIPFPPSSSPSIGPNPFESILPPYTVPLKSDVSGSAEASASRSGSISRLITTDSMGPTTEFIHDTGVEEEDILDGRVNSSRIADLEIDDRKPHLNPVPPTPKRPNPFTSNRKVSLVEDSKSYLDLGARQSWENDRENRKTAELTRKGPDLTTKAFEEQDDKDRDTKEAAERESLISVEYF